MRIVKLVWSYLAQTQPVVIRALHLIVIAMVASQFITSDLVDIRHTGEGGRSLAFAVGTWAHILPGMTLAAIMAIFVIVELYHRGLKYFFPYLWGDLAQLKADLRTLAARKLPEAAPGGLPAIVQGLGLGLLSLTLLSGLTWFLLVRDGSGWAYGAIELHEALTSLVVVYVIGHGGMGLLHMALWMRTKRR